MKLKIIWLSFDGLGFSVAYKLLQEGNEVRIGMVQDIKSLENGKTEDAEDKKLRLQSYKGILHVEDADKLLEEMATFENKDEWFVVCDFNNLWKYSEKCLKMGFTNGFFPTKADFDLESDRKAGKEIVEKHYPELTIGEVEEFKKAKDGIDYINQSNDTHVLKGYDESADTVCPVDKVDYLAKLKLIKTLEKDPKYYESKGYILEKKIKDPCEITPEAQFYNGKLVMMTVDIESKPIAAGDEGKQTGCAQNLVMQLDQSSKLAKMAFPPYVFEQAKKHTGLFVWDASILFKDKPYFGEFCANRWGWDSIQTEIAMCPSVTDYFKGLLAQKNPLKYKYGVAVRGFNDNKEKGEQEMNWMQETDKDTFIYDIKLDKEDKVTTGYWGIDLVVFTGAGNTIDEALNKAHKAKDNFSFPNMIGRPKFDFSADYPTGIMKRYKYMQDKGLISNKTVLRLK